MIRSITLKGYTICLYSVFFKAVSAIPAWCCLLIVFTYLHHHHGRMSSAQIHAARRTMLIGLRAMGATGRPHSYPNGYASTPSTHFRCPPVNSPHRRKDHLILIQHAHHRLLQKCLQLHLLYIMLSIPLKLKVIFILTRIILCDNLRNNLVQ